MVQFNLLPDVKLQYVKARRTKYLMTMISVVATAAAVSIMLFFLFMANVIQTRSLSDLQDDIDTYSAELQGVEDLSRILTVQNQLSTLTQLHDDKPVTSRLFTYISQLTPSEASLNRVEIDYEAGTLSISGDAPSLDVVSLYTDTLKATYYTMGDSTEDSPKAFSNVVLSSFSRNEQGASFTITLTFDPVIFNSQQDVKLVVPSGAKTDNTNVFEAGA